MLHYKIQKLAPKQVPLQLQLAMMMSREGKESLPELNFSRATMAFVHFNKMRRAVMVANQRFVTFHVLDSVEIVVLIFNYW